MKKDLSGLAATNYLPGCILRYIYAFHIIRVFMPLVQVSTPSNCPTPQIEP